MGAPRGWSWVPLTDVAQLESGHTPSRRHPEWWGGDVPWIGIKDARANHGQRIISTLQATNADGLANSAARLLPAGTVCLSRTASVGYVVILGKEMATSQDFVNWVCSKAVVPEYLLHLFIAEHQSLLRFSKGSTHSTIYYPEVKAFHVCLPPLNEQRRIVAKIEALQARSDAAKEALDAIPPLLEKFRQSVLAAAFRGDLTREWRAQNPDVEPASVLLERIRKERKARFIEDTAEKARAKAESKALAANKPWTDADNAQVLERERAKAEKKCKDPEPVDTPELPELPETWCWVSLGDLFVISVGATPSRKIDSYWGGDIPWVSSGEVQFCHIKDTKEKITIDGLRNTSTQMHPSGTILIGMIGEGRTRGQVAILDIEACNNQNCAAIGVVASGLSIDYVYRFLEGEYARTRRIGSGNNQQALNKTRVQQILIPLAPREEMEAISQLIESRLEFSNGIRHLVSEICDQSSALGPSILATAFRGKLVQQDPSDEPASVLLERIRAERESAQASTKGMRPRKKRGAKA